MAAAAKEEANKTKQLKQAQRDIALSVANFEEKLRKR
jgi:hypothetical protein